MITAASVKKVFRKANLCIHPDKVQQKGATLQQKYVAEKVFDLLQVINQLKLNRKELLLRLKFAVFAVIFISYMLTKHLEVASRNLLL